MCGFAGYYHPRGTYSHQDILERMTGRLAHRGPDGQGLWLSPEGIALGHRRLAIIDLSEHGFQPMASHSGRYILVFNGECYNAEHLRQELAEQAHCSWQGHSDTEVILQAIETWGIQTALTKMVGMFSGALWDCRQKSLILFRDRFGEKPLYFGWMQGALLFGSELKALKQHPLFQEEICPHATDHMLRYGYVSSSIGSIYRGIHKVLPGSFLYFTEQNLALHTTPEPVTYWDLQEKVTAPPIYQDHEIVDQLEALLENAIRLQMISDVPIGAFLSGGVDSSAIVALMQKNSHRPIKTFSIGFHETEFNEAPYAKAVAKHLGTEHTELFVSHKDALDLIPTLPQIYCEPFGDSSQIPTVLLSRLTRQHVTVALSGDGGDELFAGYGRYAIALKKWSIVQKVPSFLRKPTASLLHRIADHVPTCKKLKHLAQILPLDFPSLYQSTMGHWHYDAPLTNQISSLIDPRQLPPVDPISLMTYIDASTYLPDDILVKVDRAAMAFGLETRAPLLDVNLASFAFSLSSQQKTRGGIPKWPLKELLYRYVPQTLVDRPKKGFGIPLGQWLRGDLRDWADNLLSDTSLDQTPYINKDFFQKRWHEHRAGEANWQYGLGNILMFQSWYLNRDL